MKSSVHFFLVDNQFIPVLVLILRHIIDQLLRNFSVRLLIAHFSLNFFCFLSFHSFFGVANFFMIYYVIFSFSVFLLDEPKPCSFFPILLWDAFGAPDIFFLFLLLIFIGFFIFSFFSNLLYFLTMVYLLLVLLSLVLRLSWTLMLLLEILNSRFVKAHINSFADTLLSYNFELFWIKMVFWVSRQLKGDFLDFDWAFIRLNFWGYENNTQKQVHMPHW